MVHGSRSRWRAAAPFAGFDPDTLPGRAFAFDGTVSAVGPAVEVAPEALPSYSVATFEVHEWFVGGSGGSVAVKIQRDAAAGDRLLVSGGSSSGGDPLEDPIAWGCGFTISHDDTTADAWRSTWSQTS